jgi:RNA polymerase sigma-70 factor (ECF subfamily)
MTSSPPFERLLVEHLPMIRRIASAYESHPAIREDLVQDILYALWRALPGFRGDASLRTFIARVAANRAITHVQKAVRLPRSTAIPEQLIATGANPEGQAIASDQRVQLLSAVRGLPAGLREPTLMALEGLSVPETAVALGLSPNAVAVRLSRARSLLRTLLGDTK